MFQEKTSYVIRFAGDSGDGIQLQGLQFTMASALAGHDIATLPDFPAEIRAPAGTRYGVSAFQIQFGGERITTPGDAPDVLIAFNPAALVVNLSHLKPGALIVVDSHAFSEQRLKRADLSSNPLEDGTLDNFEVLEIDISNLTHEAVDALGLGAKDSLRCKNFWALGLILWMFDQKRDATIAWIEAKFGRLESVKNANLAALNAGHAFGETAELGPALRQHPTPEAPLEAAEYRTLTGAEALALGLVAAGELADTELMFCSYPITPASSVLHHLTGLEDAGVATFQAEDEIAAVCSAIGASYAGKLGITSSSGPGIALKTEAIGLAVATELPLVIINSQRAGPSTGMPTKTEQSDLYQAVYGRNADTPIPVISASTPDFHPQTRRQHRPQARGLQPRSENRGAAVGHPRGLAIHSSHRRNRKRHSHGQHFLRLTKPSGNDQHAGGQGRQRRQFHTRARDQHRHQRRLGSGGLGLNLRRRLPGGEAICAGWPGRGPHSSSAHQSVSAESWPTA
jgi:2-oxoglutarate ferredoxin oxidoreductase subunit alpha